MHPRVSLRYFLCVVVFPCLQIGFLGMVLTEWAAGCNTLQAWGLQPHSLGL